jgi:molybdopterin-synthase adenylyltransferase
MMVDISTVIMRPRVKPEHAPYRIRGGKIRIGGICYGIAAEIDDPDGWVWTLLTKMDGSRDLTAIVEQVRHAHPGLATGTVRSGARQLMRAGYVEDAGAARPAGLTHRDIERYDRAAGLFRWMDLSPRGSWEPQALLKAARVTVLGVGGTGGTAALALAAAGIGMLHCVDHDAVELSNLSRQILYTEDDIGTTKTGAAVTRLRQLNSDISITGECAAVRSVADVERLASDCDVFILAADEPEELQHWVNQGCLAAGRPWVYAGYNGPQVLVGAFVPGTGACLACTQTAIRARDAILGACEEDATEAPPHATSAVSAGISGFLAAHQAIALLTGVPPVTPGRLDVVNLAALSAPSSITGQRLANCSACGGTG